ncbi:hypothetical protein U27_03015 [Candidatus Vecturithrix granuli]|uniref:Microcin J25-processing protein McjB C-terminal domain-containing protein n=1 Tax=Vecturithrix granuli TaxID=1499967 RepID=A0A081BUP8_VECG1|nr:hypothetical protein U27_03015 [Candidatus Vecturithrix granuli]
MKDLASYLKIFNKFRHFESFRDVCLFFQIPLLWIALPCLLLLRLQTVLRLLTPRRQSLVREAVARDRYQKILHFAHYWLRWKWIAVYNTCLKKSLLLYYFLNREGIPAQICFGIKKNEGNLNGHSWIETPSFIPSPPDYNNDFIKIYTYPEMPVEIFSTSKNSLSS